MGATTRKKTATKKAPGRAPTRTRRAKAAPAPTTAGAPVPKGLIWRNDAAMWGVHPGVAMVQGWVRTMKKNTGRSLDEWLAFIRKEGPKDAKARREWLKVKHGIGSNVAGWLADRASSQPGATWDENPDNYLRDAVNYVESMYSGAKSGLRPIHMALIALVRKLPKDAKLCPCQTIVPVYRHHVIAQIKPRTRTVVEFGLALKDTTIPRGSRLIDTGGLAKKDRITHRFDIESPEQVDAEVERWLRRAYAMDAK